MDLLKKADLQFKFFSVQKIFLVWFIGLVLLSQLGSCVLTGMGCFKIGYFFRLANWDGQHFLHIAQFGYYYLSAFAFFPLFPSFIKIGSFLLGYVVSGLIINWVSTFLGLFFLYKLLRQDVKHNQAISILVLFLSYCFSFFYLTFYSESLFLLFSVLSFYCYKQKKIKLTLLFETLAVLTRFSGVAVIAAIWLDGFLKKKNRIILLFPIVGLVGFMLFAYFQTGNFWQIFESEENWGRFMTFPFSMIFNLIRIVSAEGIGFQNYYFFGLLVGLVILLVMTFRAHKYLSTLYWSYLLFSIAIPLSTSTLMSLPRFLIVLFPLFIALEQMFGKFWKRFYVVISSILLVLFFILFLQGEWIA